MSINTFRGTSGYVCFSISPKVDVIYKGKLPDRSDPKHPLYKANLPDRIPPHPKRDVPQAEIKRFLPLGAHIWRANKLGMWCFHNPPHKRDSVSWSEFKGDSTKAAFHAVRKSWQLFLKDNCLQETDCPIEGIF